MRSKLTLLLVVALALPGIARAQLGPLPPTSVWREYREIEDGFVVRVPNAVKGREWKDAGRPANYYLTGNPQQSFSIVAVRWPAGMRGGQTAAAILDSTVKRILDTMKPEKVERDEAQDCGEGVPGRALMAQLPDKLVFAGRVCVTSGNVYRVEAFVESAKWEEAELNVKVFLDSFKPLRR